MSLPGGVITGVFLFGVTDVELQDMRASSGGLPNSNFC